MLALTSLFIFSLLKSDSSRGQVKKASVKKILDSEQPIEFGKSVVDGVNPLGVILPSGAATSVGSGSLKSATDISLSVYANRPDGRDTRFTPVGPRAVVEISLSALDFANPNTYLVTVWIPANSALKEDAYRVLQEVGITLGDGTEYVYLDQYGDNWAVRITPAILSPIFKEYSKPKEILRVSVQPVDAKGWYEELAPDLFDEQEEQ